MKQMALELDLGYEPPLPPDWIDYLQPPHATELVKALQDHKFFQQLQLILGVTRDELHSAEDKHMAKAS